MNASLSQSTRTAKLSTPFGQDVLVLTQFDGSEGLGELFEYRIEGLSEEENLDLDKAIGKPCTVKLKVFDRPERIFNGVVVQARWLGQAGEFHRYSLVLRPWFWFLLREANCRIFLNKSARDIIKEVFEKGGFTDFEDRLTGDYPKIDYCVQYRETDFAFVSRMMESHGIYYFFKHADGNHTMILADSKSSHQPNDNLSKVPYIALAGQDRRAEEHLFAWVAERRFRTGKVALKDFDYTAPKKNLHVNHEASEKYARSKLEVYDYPSLYKEPDHGKKLAQFRLEAEQAQDYRRHASGDAPSLYAGGLVFLEKHDTSSENKEYLVVRSAHSFSTEAFSSGAQGEDDIYSGSYEFLPIDRPFRNPMVTPKPLIYGMQTALVVPKKGEDGEEISVDDQGRIWVQFFWDRDDQKSCAVRVAQVWAGKKWGGVYFPRVGMEVVVVFEDGDPDHPLVIGTVYNGDHEHPYPLPDNKTIAGVKSESSKGGGGYNEVILEDKKGSEKIGVHAQKDMDLVVLDTETRQIGERFTGKTAGPSSRKTTLLRGDDELTVATGNQQITIALNQTGSIGLNETHMVGVSQSNTIGASQTNMIGVSQMTTVGGTVTIMASAGITLISGGSTILINPSGVQIIAPTFAVVAPGGAVIKGATIPLAS